MKKKKKKGQKNEKKKKRTKNEKKKGTFHQNIYISAMKYLFYYLSKISNEIFILLFIKNQGFKSQQRNMFLQNGVTCYLCIVSCYNPYIIDSVKESHFEKNTGNIDIIMILKNTFYYNIIYLQVPLIPSIAPCICLSSHPYLLVTPINLPAPA